MNLKNHNKSGFMLTEVLIAMVIVSTMIMPVLSFIGNAIKASARYRDSSARLFVMKNLMLQQTYFAQEDKQKKKSLEEKIKEPAVALKYTRDTVGRQKPFDKLSESESQNLFVQKVEASFGSRKESIVCFLYKP